MAAQLAAVHALVVRWRRLARVAAAHAAGAHHCWFHLYRVLLQGVAGEAGDAQGEEGPDEVPWWQIGRPVRAPWMGGAGLWLDPWAVC